MPRPQNKTNCGICHEYKGIYVRMQIEGVSIWACLECLETTTLQPINQRSRRKHLHKSATETS